MSFARRGIIPELLIALAAACLLFAAPGLWAQKTSGTTQAPVAAGIRITANADPKAATIGDPIRLDLDVIMPQGYKAEIVRPLAPSADFAILDFFPGPELPGGGKERQSAQPGAPIHHRARVVLAIYQTGKFTFPPIPVKIKPAGGKDIAVSSPPVDMEIQSVLTGKNPALRDLKKQADIPEPTRWLLWGIIALSACLLCAAAWYFWRRRRRKPAPLTPAQKQNLLETAEMDLRNLLARGFPEAGREKHFYVLLSDTVKRILGAGYGIHTAELTTSEIMETLDRNSAAGHEEKRLIESFLLRCDVVKFARYVPSGNEHADAGRDALRILALAKEAVGSQQLTVGSQRTTDS